MSWPADKPKDAGLTHLASGESLLADQYICSPNDAARLMLEGNGNLTIFKLKGKPWQLNRRAKNVGVTLANQADSNLVLYDADGKPAGWASNTKGGEGSYLTVSDDGRALYTSSEGILLWSSNGKDVGGKGAPAPGSAEAEAEAAAPPAGESDAHDPPMVQGGDAAPASVEKEGSGVVQMASIAASGGVGDHPVEFIAEVKVNDLGFDFFSLLSFVSLSLSRAHASSKRLARKKKKKRHQLPPFPKKTGHLGARRAHDVQDRGLHHQQGTAQYHVPGRRRPQARGRLRVVGCRPRPRRGLGPPHLLVGRLHQGEGRPFCR
jgi:hypothetical protein